MPDDRVKLAVIIINYKTADLVIQCLRSLQGQIVEANAQVVVVDNASHDGSVAKIEDWIVTHDGEKRVDLVESATNAGFSGGNNLGIRAIDADYYLLLNSDTIVRPGAIAVMLETAEKYHRAGLTSPRLEWPDGTPQESCFRFLSPMSELIGTARTGPVTAILRNFVVPLPPSNTIVKPQWTSFACVLLRHEMVDEIGLMDEGFFMYFEDVEYCHRAHKAGWEIVHNPEARVVHLRGGSSTVKQRTLERRRLPPYYYASRSRYFYLIYGRAGLTFANVLWHLGRCVSKCRELVERRERGAPDKGWLDIWTNWRHPDALWSDTKRR
jgi:N-acetylglucosaminyl-diphospho-decaprenol L-rhamnosyltransferase